MLKYMAGATVVSLPPTAPVSEVARVMKSKNIGSVAILGGGWPVGILTERDIVVRVVEPGLDPSLTPVERVMSHNPLMLDEQTDIPGALEAMRKKGVRRALMVDGELKPVGFSRWMMRIAWVIR